MYLESKYFMKGLREHIIPRGQNGILTLRWVIKGTRILRSLHTTDMDEAIEVALKIMEESVGKNPSKITIMDLLTEWNTAARRSKDYFPEVKRVVREFCDLYGDLKISDVTKREVQQYKIHLLNKVYRTDKATGKELRLSGWSINGYLRMLRSLFGFAVKMEYLSKNPFSNFGNVKQLNPLPHAFKPEELRRILARAEERFGHDYSLVAEFFFHTGVRPKEGAKVLWEMVDFDERVLDLKADITKNGYERKVPLTSRAIQILVELKARHPRPAFIHQDTISKRFSKILKDLALHGEFYDVKTTCNTWLKESIGDSFAEMVLGHLPPGVNARSYTSYEMEVMRHGLEANDRMLHPPTQVQSLDGGVSQSDVPDYKQLYFALLRIQQGGGAPFHAGSDSEVA